MQTKITTAAGIAVTCSWLAIACGGGTSTPTNPGSGSGSGSGNSSCRTYPTVAQSTTTAQNYTATTTVTQSFNAATKQGMLTTQSSDNVGCASTTTSIVVYNTLSDFVDEAKVIPPLILAASSSANTVATGTCSSGSGPTSVTYTYNGKRLTRYVVTSGPANSTTTFTAWDSSDRPTAGTINSVAGLVTLAYVYNNSARTATLTATATAGGVGNVSVTTYDANGNQILLTTTSGPNVSTTVTTIGATAVVCT